MITNYHYLKQTNLSKEHLQCKIIQNKRFFQQQK